MKVIPLREIERVVRLHRAITDVLTFKVVERKDKRLQDGKSLDPDRFYVQAGHPLGFAASDDMDLESAQARRDMLSLIYAEKTLAELEALTSQRITQLAA